MADANDVDLEQFKLWYSQAGTPEVRVEARHDAAARRLELTLEQTTAPTPGQAEKSPLHLPLEVGLIGADGAALPLRLEGETAALGTSRVLQLTEARARFCFEDIEAAPLVSLNRNFTAPIKLADGLEAADRAFLMRHDSDPFNRWEAGQRLAIEVLLARAQALLAGAAPPPGEAFLDAFAACLADDSLDDAFRAELLALPSESYLGEQMAVIDVEAVHGAREGLAREIAARHGPALTRLHNSLRDNQPYSPDAAAAGRRSLRNSALGYLAMGEAGAAASLLRGRYRDADNMTDRMAALGLLADREGEASEEALRDFHDRYRDDTLVIDKWFAVQATSSLPGTLARVESLLGHAAFSLRSPNRVRALIGAFVSGNQLRFHGPDGAGYDFLVRRVLELDPLNPQIAARLMTPLGRWRRFDAGRQAAMKGALERVLAASNLSRDVYEIASKSLAPEQDANGESTT